MGFLDTFPTANLLTSAQTSLVEHKSAKTPLSEQGDVKEEGSVLWVRDRRLNVRLPLRGVCSVEPLRGLVKPRNLHDHDVAATHVILLTEQNRLAIGAGEAGT